MAAFVVLPLHLALAGAPHVVTILVLAWMFCQWPLAHYLSLSGKLDRAVGVSAALFAVFISAVCFLTGGAQSFALPWLLIPPIEAALAVNRRVSIAVAGLCAVLYAFLLLLPGPEVVQTLPVSVQIVSVIGAMLNIGVLALRVSADRKLAVMLIGKANTQRDLLNQCSSDVMCEITSDNKIRILGGPVRDVFGSTALNQDSDWIFQRIHVVDRPLYLSQLSSASHDSGHSACEIRVRTGETEPGQVGAVNFQWMEVRFHPVSDTDTASISRNGSVFLSFRNLGEDKHRVSALSELDRPEMMRFDSGKLFERASTELRAPLVDIASLGEKLIATANDQHSNCVRKNAEEILVKADEGLTALSSLIDLAPTREHAHENQSERFDLGVCLSSCERMLAPSAELQGIDLQFKVPHPTVLAVCDQTTIRKAVCFLVSDMLETAGHDASICVAGETDQSGLSISISVRNREKAWNLETAEPVLGYIQELLKRVDATLDTQAILGAGESVTMRIPCPVVVDADSDCVPERASAELAKIA
ncbi:MAG: hypothetical protein ABJP14_03330 [Roseibium sp.]